MKILLCRIHAKRQIKDIRYLETMKHYSTLRMFSKEHGDQSALYSLTKR